MTSRVRAAALDVPSIVASAAQSSIKLARVQAVIVSLLAEGGSMTHDELIEAYNKRAATSDAVPYVTEQSVRTRTAELVRRGLVRASDTPGRSKHGYPSTKWVTT